jgi:sialate O-acetylesterase
MKYPKYNGQLDTLSFLAQNVDKIKKQQTDTLNAWQNKVDSIERRYFHNDTLIRTLQYDDKNWQMMDVPGYWEKSVLPDYDGIVYFRKEFDLSTDLAGLEATLYLASIDDMDKTWVNDRLVGATDGYNISRKYKIPAGLLKEGKNIIVVKVIDTYLDGGIYGLKDQVCIDFKSRRIPLAGKWKYLATINYKQLPKYPSFETRWYPTTIFNGMIAPLLPLPIKGIIWYQGESNTYDSYNYRNLFPDMIKSWRERWNIGNFPFYYVQLANYQTGGLSDGDWPLLRESQLKTLTVPSTGMAVTIDIGNPNDIHPRNKQEVGRRLALLALHYQYGGRIPFTGPVYKSYIIEGNTIRINFDNVFGGLMAKDGDLKWFEIAGSDGKFVKAQAVIQKNQVVVWSENIPNPVAVRYAWNINPEGCNLINSSGIPASPFRTNQ